MAEQAGRQRYSTDLTDEQWERIRPYLERPGRLGRPTRLDLREVVNALFYFTRVGCPWRMLPHEFPKWESVRYYFEKWAREGTWETIQAALVQQVRTQAGRAAQPSGFAIDSQRTKTTEAGGPRGFDGGKKSHGAQAPQCGRYSGPAARHRGGHG